MYECVNSI